MYTLDLKLVLLGLLLVVGMTVVLMQRREQRRRISTALAVLRPVLLNAPLAVVAFDQTMTIQ